MVITNSFTFFVNWELLRYWTGISKRDRDGDQALDWRRMNYKFEHTNWTGITKMDRGLSPVPFTPFQTYSVIP